MKNRVKVIGQICVAALFLSSCVSKERNETITGDTPVFHATEYKTDTLDVNGTVYTYRKTGKNEQTDIPLILFIHTRGNLDSWDPALIEKLGAERTVITFNNSGVAGSGGQTPESFALMADDAHQFIQALGYDKVDLLGFSIGGCVVQEVLMRHNEIARNAILAGTSPKGARSINRRDPKIAELVKRPTLGLEEFQALFFNTSDNSRKLGEAFWQRKSAGKYPKDLVVGIEAAKAQAIARERWGNDTLNPIDYEKIANPVLIANGKVDLQMPTHNSVELYNLLPNAQLNLYPDAGHGFLFQYPEIFASDVNRFLNSNN